VQYVMGVPLAQNQLRTEGRIANVREERVQTEMCVPDHHKVGPSSALVPESTNLLQGPWRERCVVMNCL
jgi:hypothetical protein